MTDFFPSIISLGLSRGSVEYLRELVGKEPVSSETAIRLHARLRTELNKTCDDIQHEKLERATRAAQEVALEEVLQCGDPECMICPAEDGDSMSRPAPGNVLIEVSSNDARWIRAWAQNRFMALTASRSGFAFIKEAADRVITAVDVALEEVRDDGC